MIDKSEHTEERIDPDRLRIFVHLSTEEVKQISDELQNEPDWITMFLTKDVSKWSHRMYEVIVKHLGEPYKEE